MGTTGTTGDIIVIDGGATGFAFVIDDDDDLRQVEFGSGVTGRPLDFPPVLYPLAYPTFGDEPLREAALRVTHADGVTSTRLRARRWSSRLLDEGTETRIVLEDRAAPLEVVLAFRAWPAHGVVEQWVEVSNHAGGPITVHALAATSVAFADADAHLTHWGGGWAGEWTETTERLTAGVKVVASGGGVRSSLYRPPIVLVAPGGRATETGGRVAACTLRWGGDSRFAAEVALHGQGRLIAGTRMDGAERVLDPGGTFASPVAVWAHADDGIGPTSRALHRYVRDQAVRDGHRTRATVVNTWEAIGFRLDPDGLAAQVDRAGELGAELFLLDDGWFGVSHPRDDDTVGLGDWEVDRRKLPDGLAPIVEHTLERGLRFGLWVEPEMVNPGSTLAATHPDWVIGEPGRTAREERNQLVLDLCRPEVRAFCVDTIDRLLAEHPGITYLKWDANRDITEPGSAALPVDRQSHLPIDRVHATWEVMAEVARRHPAVELMLCASGGGRSDLGTLRFFHELWTSDNTDPVDRVRIQWGASHLLPASVLGAHVTRWGLRPFAFACAVAMSGRFGFDIDLTGLSNDEWEIARDATTSYHRLRPTVQHGDLHRLVSPIDSTRGAVATVSQDGGSIAVFGFRLPGDPLPEGAAPDAIAVPRVLLGRHRWSVEDLSPGRAFDVGGMDDISGGDGASLPWPPGEAPSGAVYLLSRVG